MAHAAVVSLIHTIDQILNANRVSIPYQLPQIEFLQKKLNSLLDFLEKTSQSSSEKVKSLETKIRDVAYWAEDVIESRIFLSRSYSQESESSSQERFPMLQSLICDDEPHAELRKIIAETDSIVEEVEKTIGEIDSIIEEVEKIMNMELRNTLPSSSHPSDQAIMVGFDEEVTQIKEQLCNDKNYLQIIPIIGMGGIGKTTLAKNIYDDLFVRYHFDIRAFVTVSQQYRMKDILLSLLIDMGFASALILNKDDDELKEQLYKHLKCNRYLIVVDDLWSTKFWDDIQRLFPNDQTRSRIILTTRLKHIADYINPYGNHRIMRFLDEEESWELFCTKVFGGSNCPFELVDVGKKIVQNCQGLPLLIVVTGGLLSKFDKTLDYWESVSENLISIVTENDEWCLKILTLSYNYLPPHLKTCFLYIGVFPSNYDIPVSRLIKLWVAEGFVKPNESKCFEEVAEEYLKDLVDRNLILVRQKGSIRGRNKSCSMHDLLRELCVRISHKEKYFSVRSKHLNFFPEKETLNRRFCIHDDALSDEEDITLQSMSLVRSFIYTGWDETQLHSYYYFGCLLLRVLDMVGVELEMLPHEVFQLINLRYLAIAATHINKIPCSINFLRNLQTLIVEDQWGFQVELPEEILSMVQLRHIKISRVSLPQAFYIPFNDSDGHSVLSNLQTLSKVQDLVMTEHVFEKIPNVKKLGIYYSTNELPFCDVHPQHLEALKIIFESPTNSTFLRSITSAPRLKKITMEHGRIGWEDMTIFGLLPNLEVLKLRDFAFTGPEWEPTEGEFLNLKFLQIWKTDLEQWRAEKCHFPKLEHLFIGNCSELAAIPSDIGNIDTLKIIEADKLSPSVVKSALDIFEEQQELGNNLQVIFHETKQRLHPFKFGIQQDESGSLHRGKTKLDELRRHESDGSGESDLEELWHERSEQEEEQMTGNEPQEFETP